MTMLEAHTRPSADVARGGRSQAALTRLARRTARGGGWRHVLVVTLIALSVAAATAVAVASRSSRSTTEQELAWRFGAGDLRVESHVAGQPAFGDLPPQLQQFVRDAGLPVDTDRPSRDPSQLIADVAPEADSAGFATVWLSTGTGGGLQLIAADPHDPLLEPMWDVTGPAPGTGEAMLSRGAMRELNTEVGQDVDLPLIGRVRVVGEAVIPHRVHSATAIVHPDADLGTQASRLAIVAVPGDSNDLAARLSDAAADQHIGVEVRESTAALLESGADRSVTDAPIFRGTVLGSVLLAQVAFVAAAAFATGIRRRLRQLGLLGANGADPRQIRGLVRREALVLGTFGGILGAGLGVLTAWLGQPITQRVTDRLIDGLVVRPLDLLAPAALGAVSALVAAYLPARTAARVPVVTALAGRLPVRSVPRWITPAALASAAAGLALIALIIRRPGGSSLDFVLVAAGTVVTLLGAAMLAVPTLGLIGRFADRLPIRARLVVRDTVRQRARSAAAVAALTVVLIVPVVIATTAMTDAARWSPQGESRRDVVTITGPWYEGAELLPSDDMVARVRESLPRVESQLTIPYYGVPGAWVIAMLEPPIVTDGGAAVASAIDRIGVADPQLLAMLGVDRPLTPDEVVVLGAPGSGELLRDTWRAQLYLDVSSPDGEEGQPPTARPVDVVPAESEISTADIPQLVVHPELASELGLEPVGGSILLDLERDLTRDELPAVHRIGENEAVPFHVSASHAGDADPSAMIAVVLGIALAVALLISGMTAALAATESDRDLELMTAVGADPRLRRMFHGLQGGYHALVAAGLAIPAGLLLARAVTNTSSGIVIPWMWLLAVLFLLPLMVGLAHRTLMRSSSVQAPRRIT